MGLNCKEGDLAVIVDGAVLQNIGLVVSVVRACTEANALTIGDRYVYNGTLWRRSGSSFMWVVESCGRPLGEAVNNIPHKSRPYPDSCLRPIRDTDGDDQTLTWAGKPQPIELPKKAVPKYEDFTSDNAAEDFVLRNPTRTARVIEKNIVVSYYYGSAVKA